MELYIKRLHVNSSSRMVLDHFTANIPEWNEGKIIHSHYNLGRQRSLGGILLRVRSLDHIHSAPVATKSQS